jgi:hypothetical protein
VKANGNNALNVFELELVVFILPVPESPLVIRRFFLGIIERLLKLHLETADSCQHMRRRRDK